jgi:hypothetical protein
VVVAVLRRRSFSLEALPNRCPVTPESDTFRHLRYGNKPYVERLIYRVQEARKQVDVLPVRLGRRSEFQEGDVV